MPDRVAMRCDICGQTDDHPKHHYMNQTFHHDCTPAYVLDDMTHETFYTRDAAGNAFVTSRVPIPEENWHPGTKMYFKIREKALSGTHGNELLAHIERLHESHVQDPEGLGMEPKLMVPEQEV
jgi:hypothetical protein